MTIVASNKILHNTQNFSWLVTYVDLFLVGYVRNYAIYTYLV